MTKQAKWEHERKTKHRQGKLHTARYTAHTKENKQQARKIQHTADLQIKVIRAYKATHGRKTSKQYPKEIHQKKTGCLADKKTDGLRQIANNKGNGANGQGRHNIRSSQYTKRCSSKTNKQKHSSLTKPRSRKANPNNQQAIQKAD